MLPMHTFLMALMLFCIFWPSASKNSNQHSKFDRIWKARKENCERTEECQELPPAESMNCVNLCLSEVCYNEVYEKEPLEDGEIDKKRDLQFTKCLRKEERDRRKN